MPSSFIYGDVAVFRERYHLLDDAVDIGNLVSESFFELSYSLGEVRVVLQEVLSHDEEIIVADLLEIRLDAVPDLMLYAEKRDLQLRELLDLDQLAPRRSVFKLVRRGDLSRFYVFSPSSVAGVLQLRVVVFRLGVYYFKPATRDICVSIVDPWDKHSCSAVEHARSILDLPVYEFSESSVDSLRHSTSPDYLHVAAVS